MLRMSPGLGHPAGGCPRARDPAHPAPGTVWLPCSCIKLGRAGVGSPAMRLLHFLAVRASLVACRGAL